MSAGRREERERKRARNEAREKEEKKRETKRKNLVFIYISYILFLISCITRQLDIITYVYYTLIQLPIREKKLFCNNDHHELFNCLVMSGSTCEPCEHLSENIPPITLQ